MSLSLKIKKDFGGFVLDMALEAGEEERLPCWEGPAAEKA